MSTGLPDGVYRLSRVALLIALASLSACVGIGVFVPEERRYPADPDTGAMTRERVSLSPPHRGRVPAVHQDGDTEIWVYDQGHGWCGALIVVIPLMLPVCSAEDTYVFRNEHLVERRARFARFKGVACGIFPVCPGGSNCRLCTSQ